jgi:cytoskeleton protein RodZ
MQSIGEQFRVARQQRNLSIDEVSRLTKIGVRLIDAIEQGNFRSLPPTYMRSFVRTYAAFLDIPEPLDIPSDEAVHPQRFQPQMTEQISPLSMPANVFTPGYFSDQRIRNKRILATIYTVVACLLTIVGYLILTAPPVPRKADDTALTRPLRIIVEAIKPGSTSLSLSSLRDSSMGRALQNADSMVLEARAIESVWINVVMDKRRTDQQTLEAGKTYRWGAEKVFSLSVGNAGGVYFTLNGRPLQQFGAKGFVIRDIRITRDAVRGEFINASNTPAIVRNLNSPLTPASGQPTSRISSQISSEISSQAQARTPPKTFGSISNTNAPVNAAQSPAPNSTSRADSASMSAPVRTRFSFRRKPVRKTLIDPVIPNFAPPNPTAFKPLAVPSNRN